jgi:tRNA(Arg) A34 adenosine deaminase TadA
VCVCVCWSWCGVAHRQLSGTTLVVSLEPCPLCVQAAAAARVHAIVYAAARPARATPPVLPRATLEADADAAALLSGWFARTLRKRAPP